MSAPHQCPDYPTDSVIPCSTNDPAWYRLRSATGTNYSTIIIIVITLFNTANCQTAVNVTYSIDKHESEYKP